jgi:hypothetical protein
LDQVYQNVHAILRFVSLYLTQIHPPQFQNNPKHNKYNWLIWDNTQIWFWNLHSFYTKKNQNPKDTHKKTQNILFIISMCIIAHKLYPNIWKKISASNFQSSFFHLMNYSFIPYSVQFQIVSLYDSDAYDTLYFQKSSPLLFKLTPVATTCLSLTTMEVWRVLRLFLY